MPYIIENANLLKENKILKKSILIRDNKIGEMESEFKHYHFMKMNAEPYIMTPTHVLLDSQIPIHSPFKVLKEYIIEKYLLNGCTTFLTYVSVSFENELNEKIERVKNSLLSCPIDFLIGVKIPLKHLTPSFIRICKRKKVPAIFMEIDHLNDFERVPWGWIKEALFPYNCPLIPVISKWEKNDKKNILAIWKDCMLREKIPGIAETLEENIPLNPTVLNKIGLIPQKSCFRHGAEVSYNLYLKTREIKNVDERQLFLYHRNRLIITVHKGNVIRSGDEVLFKSGYGEYVKVTTPSFFSGT